MYSAPGLKPEHHHHRRCRPWRARLKRAALVTGTGAVATVFLYRALVALAGGA